MPEPAPIHPAHVTSSGATHTTGIDLDIPCRCDDPAACPCRCHVANRHRRNVHPEPARWCPACRAIAAQTKEPTE